MFLAAALLLCSCWHPENYDKTVADGVSSIATAAEFARLFPHAHHFISYYSGQKGPPTWHSEVGLSHRYILSVQLPITLDRAQGRVAASGAPEFLLLEVTQVSTLPDGRISYQSGQSIRFGVAEWRRFIESHGDLSTLGVTGPIVPVKDFDKVPGA